MGGGGLGTKSKVGSGRAHGGLGGESSWGGEHWDRCHGVRPGVAGVEGRVSCGDVEENVGRSTRGEGEL